MLLDQLQRQTCAPSSKTAEWAWASSPFKLMEFNMCVRMVKKSKELFGFWCFVFLSVCSYCWFFLIVKFCWLPFLCHTWLIDISLQQLIKWSSLLLINYRKTWPDGLKVAKMWSFGSLSGYSLASLSSSNRDSNKPLGNLLCCLHIVLTMSLTGLKVLKKALLAV